MCITCVINHILQDKMIYKTNINPGNAAVYAVGNKKQDIAVRGTYSVNRGPKGQFGDIELTMYGYDVNYVGNNCGVTITSFLAGNKIMIKAVADSSDSHHSVVKFDLKRIPQ